MSAEGTTQGDPLAMGLYALSIQPLITSLQGVCKIKQCWFANDASGVGPVAEIKKWWDTLSAIGPDLLLVTIQMARNAGLSPSQIGR